MTEFSQPQRTSRTNRAVLPSQNSVVSGGNPTGSAARMMLALRAPDARVGAGECNRGMDSFDTLPLIAAPLLGIVLIIATVIGSLIIA